MNCIHFDCGICCLGEGDECVKKPGCGYEPMPLADYKAIAIAAWQYLAELEMGTGRLIEIANAERLAAKKLTDADPEGADRVIQYKAKQHYKVATRYEAKAMAQLAETDRLRDLIGDPR